MPDPIKPTQADYAIAKRANELWGAAINGPHVAVLAAMMAREQALEEAAKVADFEIKSQPDDDYQLGCTDVASAISQAIRALKEQRPC